MNTTIIPDRGPGLWIRIQHRFGPRMNEWVIGWIIAIWGVVLLLPAETFEGPNFAFFKIVMSEFNWGIFMLVMGVGRIVGLIINGARKNVTPWIRVTSAFFGFILWVGICTAFGLSGVVSTWIAIYPTFAVIELVNIYRAAHDAGGNYAGTARHS